MSTDINLLAQRNGGFFSEERMLLGVRALAVVSIIVVISLSILFFLLSRDSSITAVKADESRTIAQLTLLQNKTAKYLIIVDRVNKIKTFEKKRSNFDTTIATIMQQIPTGAVITDFTLDQTDISISVSASDLSLLGTTLDNFTKLIGNKKILKTLTVQGLVSDEKGGQYVLTLTGGLL